jgi:CubicO group peptidase (beta-lactamase class C family)
LIFEQHPITTPWQPATYGDESFQLLAMAYELITGEAFPDAFKSAIVDPLNLERTSWTFPMNESNIVIVDPTGVETYEEDLGISHRISYLTPSIHITVEIKLMVPPQSRWRVGISLRSGRNWPLDSPLLSPPTAHHSRMAQA